MQWADFSVSFSYLDQFGLLTAVWSEVLATGTLQKDMIPGASERDREKDRGCKGVQWAPNMASFYSA